MNPFVKSIADLYLDIFEYSKLEIAYMPSWVRFIINLYNYWLDWCKNNIIDKQDSYAHNLILWCTKKKHSKIFNPKSLTTENLNSETLILSSLGWTNLKLSPCICSILNLKSSLRSPPKYESMLHSRYPQEFQYNLPENNQGLLKNFQKRILAISQL